MNNSRESLNSTETIVYPFCYKIKDNCLPCNNNNKINITLPIDCISELAKFEKTNSPYFNKELKEKYFDNLFNCLKKYGDIYKELGIELYVNPKTKEIIFPDINRIQSNFNLFLNYDNFDKSSPEELENLNHKLMLYNILLNDKFRQKYNQFYNSSGFADVESLMPKEYGIARILGKEIEKEGGKRKKIKISKVRQAFRKTKKNKRNNKIKQKTMSRK